MPRSGAFSYDVTGTFEMAQQKNMMPVFEKRLAAATGSPISRPAGKSGHRLDVAVVFTSAAATVLALKKAGTLAESLGARIALLVPQIVPFPLPLESPPILIDFSENRFREIAAESRVETTVQIYLCRDRLETLKAVLAPHSLVIIGGRKCWWPTRDKVLVRRLRRAGHQVVFAETEQEN
jgi:hypothetical protein